jgi:hypothetical protein
MCKHTVQTRHNRKQAADVFPLFRTDLLISSLLPIFIVAIPTELRLKHVWSVSQYGTHIQFALDSISFMPDFNDGRKHVKRIEVCLDAGWKL